MTDGRGAGPRGSRDEERRRGRGLTVIFKGSNLCNGGCTFCSVGQTEGPKITDEDFEVLARQVDDALRRWRIERLTFTFHGGEPTLLGAEFIDRACRRIRGLPADVTFNMQSNLLDIGEKMIDVIERNDIKLGTSFDPITRERRDRNGADAFPQWMDTMIRLSRRGLVPGAIYVVTRSSLGQADRLFRAAEAVNGAVGGRFGVQINHCYAQGRAADAEELNISDVEFGRFLVDIWSIWERSGRRMTLTPIQTLARRIYGPPDGREAGLACSFAGNCERTHVGIDFDLNVAGCGRRLDSKAFLGNLRERSLVDIVEQSEEKRNIGRRSEILRNTECSDCRFFDLCHGGCPDDAWISSGNVMSRIKWCASYRMLFEAMEAVRGQTSEAMRFGSEPAGGQAVEEKGDGRGSRTNEPRDGSGRDGPREAGPIERGFRGPEPRGGGPRGPEPRGGGPRGPGPRAREGREDDEASERRRVEEPEGPLNVRLVVDPGEVGEGTSGGRVRTEFWVLPTSDGRALRFDSPLGGPPGPRRRRPYGIRLFVHNRFVRSLVMWEDLLAQPGVLVVLFESVDLGAALGLLNDLRATVVLDVPAIVRDAEGREALEKAVGRFVGDAAWTAQVLPFSRMLLRTMRNQPPRYYDRFGAPPRDIHVHVEPSVSHAEPEAATIVETVRSEERDFGLWLESRGACMDCALLDACGACMAAGDGKPCAPEAKSMAEKVVAVARDLRGKVDLHEPPFGPGPRRPAPRPPR